MNYTRDQILGKLHEKGYPTPGGQYGLVLVGVRSKADKPNEFDDCLYLITKDSFHQFTATTNPGVDWLQTFLNPKGAAVLKPGTYKYKLGFHKDYEALVQAAPVTVYRDANKNLKSEEQGLEDTGYFAINIHRANPTLMSKIIGKWSAGCQVIADPKDFALLVSECKKSGQKEFPYSLLNEF